MMTWTPEGHTLDLCALTREAVEALELIQDASLSDYRRGIQSSEMCSAVARGISAIAKAKVAP